MTFRRSKEDSQRARRWAKFTEELSRLFEESGVPAHIYASQDHFEDFLMHGYLDHHERPFPFSVNELSESQRAILRELVVTYLASGFGDPGLGLFGSSEHDAIRREANQR